MPIIKITCYKCGYSVERDLEEITSAHLAKGHNPAPWLLGPHLKCSDCGARGAEALVSRD